MLKPVSASSRLPNREIIAAVKKLIPRAVIPLSNRVRPHPEYEFDHRFVRIVRLSTGVASSRGKRFLSRRINNLMWAMHSGPAWYKCEWDGQVVTLILDKNGD